MAGWRIILIVLGSCAALHVLASVLPHALFRIRPGRAPETGLVIFVESIRWLGVRWGMRPVEAGLRRAGFEGRLLYWRWHAGWRGWLVLPAIMDRSLLEREARKLADFIAATRRDRPDVPIHLIGYSCGGFVALRALEALGEGVCVDGAALLAGAFDPRRDLATAASRVRGRLAATSSVLDWLILGLGTLVFGTGDRRHGFSAGMVGLVPAARPPNVVEIRWRPGMVRVGHMGGHFSATAPAFIARYVAPAMGLGRSGRECGHATA